MNSFWPLVRLTLCALALTLGSPAYANPNYSWQNVERVVAIGDVHGHYSGLEQILIDTGVIDEQLRWRAGQTHLVSLGDLLDRGPDSRQAIDLLMALQPQAANAGGAVHVLLGNHELMNLTGQLRDLSAEELTSYGEAAGHRALFAPNGRYGSWLLARPSVIRINDSLFAHGGLSSLAAQHNLDELNRAVSDSVQKVLSLGAQLRQAGVISPEGDILTAELMSQTDSEDPRWQRLNALVTSPHLGELSLQWYRGNAVCHPIFEQPRVEAALRNLKARRVVVGHTPTPTRQIETRLDQQVFAIDTGMLTAVYKGQARALELLASDGQTRMFVIDASGRRAFEATAASTDSLVTQTLSKREAQRAHAAYLLDRKLGLGFVPYSTFERSSFELQTHVPRSFTENDRAGRGIYRPNHCETGNAYHLLAAFDALLGLKARDPEALRYNVRNWNLIATNNHLGLGTGTTIPQFAEPIALPKLLAERLGELNQTELEKEFDGLLSRRQIRALLKRRDRILEWPVSP